MKIRKYNSGDIAKCLRKDMTPWERHLWYDFLKDYPVKFYRQRSFGSYVVDFYSSKANLVIELDGSEHYTVEHRECDEKRTNFLEGLGMKVIRFSNLDVDRNFSGVCLEIDSIVKSRLN